jgi:hypothetical protein
MLNFRWVVLHVLGSIVLLVAVAPRTSAETYQYIGNPFTTLTPPLELADSVSGTITLSSALAPNLVDSNALLLVTAFEWTDGVRTFQFPGDSFAFADFHVSTDGSGNITQWFASFALTQGNAIGTCNDPAGLYFDCTIFGAFGSASGSVGDLTQVPAGGLFPTSYVVDDPGTWTLLPAPVLVSTLGPIAILVLGAALGAISLWAVPKVRRGIAIG